MRYLYIAGLEHSGTTLLAQILASQANVVTLGEVGQFLSRSHMEEYLRRWGSFPDVKLCSCGEQWSDCEFWSDLMHLNGVFDNDRIADGYQKLLETLQERQESRFIVDSSKTLTYLDALKSAWHAQDLPVQALGVVVTAKDPRGFAHSISRKGDKPVGVLASYRAMNWWQSVYSHWLENGEVPSRAKRFVSYEQTCNAPQQVLTTISEMLDSQFVDEINVSHSNSHIALGNKDFIERNRTQIRYDDNWKKNWQIQAAHCLNLKARQTYSRFLQLSNQSQTPVQQRLTPTRSDPTNL